MKIKLIENEAGGVDLMTERDTDNKIRILTGSPEHSRQFWQEMTQVAELALRWVEEATPA